MEKALLCLNASAGSGKTYRLVARYIELLFLGAKPSEILTLTFTKKAAKEMEERIIHNIQEMYMHRNDIQYIKKLEYININDEAIIQEKISQIYESFFKEDLKITTIDSFFQRILKNFCWYVGVEYDFEIKNEDMKAIVEVFLEKLSREDFEKIVNFCFQRKSNLDAILRGCEFLDSFKELLNKDLFVSKKYPQATIQDLRNAENKAMEYAEKIKRSYQEQEGKSHNQLEFSNFKGLLEKGKTWITKDCLQDYRGFSKIVFSKEEFLRFKEAILEVFLIEEALYLKDLGRFFYAYLQSKEQYYKQSNTLSFNAVASKVYRLLSQKDFDKDFLYFRLDSVISHILIDEFQDTSILQYEILKPLIDEIKSGKGAKKFLRSFFYVGDIKQSIYRFRGGNPELFGYASEGMVKEDLPKNYRSAKNIVEFVNEVFLGKIDGFIAQEANSQDQGFVRVIANEDVYQKAYESIQELLELGAVQEEIAILMFKNDSIVKLAEFLQNKGLKVVIDTSAKLITHNEVRALIEALKYLSTKNAKFLEEFFMLLGLEKGSLEKYCEILGKSPSLVLFEIMSDFSIASLSAKKFLEYSLGFSDIASLLDGVEMLQEDIVSSDFSGIRITTIHKSKGLEFCHIVIVDEENRANNTNSGVFFEWEDNGIEIKRLFCYNSFRANLNLDSDKEYQLAKEKERQMSIKDLKNQLYVALTRAKNTMHILLPLKKGTSEQNGRFEILDLKEGVKGDLSKAIQEKKQESQKQKESLNNPQKLQSSKQILKKLGQQEQMQVIEDKTKRVDGSLESIYYGIALHFVMEQKIKNQLEDSLVLNLLLNKIGFYLQEETLQKIIAQCKILLKNPHFIEIMDKGKVKCEVPFLINGRQKRLDLLVVGEKEVFIIDYKSGMPREVYEMQVLEYMQNVKDILKKPTCGFIYYTQGEGKLVEVIGD